MQVHVKNNDTFLSFDSIYCIIFHTCNSFVHKDYFRLTYYGNQSCLKAGADPCICFQCSAIYFDRSIRIF